MMTTQAAGSWVVGEAVEAGVSYDGVFVTATVGLAVLVLAYAVANAAGRVPGGAAGS
jgi:hypothetical protein